MTLKTDYRMIYAILALGIIFNLLAVLTYVRLDNESQLIMTSFLLCSGLIFISIGILVKSRFKLNEHNIEITNLIGLGKKIIFFSEVNRVQFIDKDLPVTSSYKNPLFLILWNKKFKRIKQLILFSDQEKIIKIDGRLIEDIDFEKLKKGLKKACLQQQNTRKSGSSASLTGNQYSKSNSS